MAYRKKTSILDQKYEKQIFGELYYKDDNNPIIFALIQGFRMLSLFLDAMSKAVQDDISSKTVPIWLICILEGQLEPGETGYKGDSVWTGAAKKYIFFMSA